MISSRDPSLVAGTITLPSSILQFWDLGGQRGIRNIWSKYYDDCHAVVYVIDTEDRERLGEGWEVFGMCVLLVLSVFFNFFSLFLFGSFLTIRRNVDAVLTAPQILGVPLLLLANKQDSPLSLSVEEIRHDYEDWYQRKLESARRDTRHGQPESERAARKERIASLEVLGVSALEGYAISSHQNRRAEQKQWFFLLLGPGSGKLLIGCSSAYRIADGNTFDSTFIKKLTPVW